MENTQYDDNDALAEEVDQQNNELYDSSEEISDEEENSDPLNTLEDKIEPDVEKNSLKNVGSSSSIKAPREKIIFNITDAKYDVIKLAGKKDMKWTLSTKPGDGWDVLWQDKTIAVETLAKMLPYQKINHFPGMLAIARKNTLGKNLMKMNKLYPDKYKFFPKTYLLPSDYQDFKNQFNSSKPKTFIIKPEAGSQGRGIFLTNKLDSVTKQDRCVAQKYLTDPYLIDGLKFDLRLYVLIAGCDPLRIFLHKQGLGRFATEPYVAPTEENMENVCMHLTNYAINKDSPNFVFNEGSDADDVGHKKSLTAVFKILKEEGHDTDKLWREIKKIIIKTFCSIQPILAHNYRSCHPNEPYNNMCFEVLGFDIMLDSKIKPWLIEVNHLPSFTTDTPLDQSIKRKVIGDALKIMNVSSKARIEYKTKRKAELHQRTISSKKTKITPEERQALFESAQKERDGWEAVNHGEFERIYPLSEEEREAGKQQEYEEYILAAKQDWQAWTGTEVKKPVKPNKKLDVSQEPPTIDTENSAAKGWNGNTKLTTATPTTTTQTTSASSLATTKFPSRAQSRPATSMTSRSTNNDLSASAAVSHRTATSSRMDNREAPIGPWCDEHITEYSDGDSFDSGQMNPNKEHNNHDILEDEPVTRLTKQEKLQLDYQNHLLYQKERQPKPTPTLQEEPAEDLSSSRYLTNRARTPKTRNDIMNKSVSNASSNMKKTESQPQSANKTSYNSRPYTSSVNRSTTPADDRRKKFLFNDNKKTTKEAKSPEEVKELKEAFDAKSKKYTPSTKYSRVSGLNKSRNPKSPARSGESSPARQDTSNAASPSPKHTRNDTGSSLHKREYNVSKQNSINYPRYVSPKREATNPSRDIVKKLEFSVGPPAVNQRPATAVKKENTTNEQEKRRTGSPISRPQTVYKDNKKPQSKASEVSVQNIQLNTKLAKPKPKDAPEAKNQPVNITLSLSKKHMRPNMAELEEKMKKVWPIGGLGIAKPSVARIEPQLEQPLVSQVLSPQYYRVKLSKDPSGLEVHTVTLAPPKKTITKSASNRLKDISIQEIDSIGLAHNLLNHSTSRSMLMDVLATPKVA